MKKSESNFDFLRFILLLIAALSTGIFLQDMFKNASADKTLNVFGLLALFTGCFMVWGASLLIPAGYDPAQTSIQSHLIRLTATFLPVLLLVIALSLKENALEAAPILAPLVGILGYIAGCKIAEKNKTA